MRGLDPQSLLTDLYTDKPYAKDIKPQELQRTSFQVLLTKSESILFDLGASIQKLNFFFQIDRLWKDRLEHPIVNAEITKFMDKKWMVKEQQDINQS